MKRTLKEIDRNKWYHLETLKKFYEGWNCREFSQKDRFNNSFDFVQFTKVFSNDTFVVDKKSRRCKYLTAESLDEIGYDKRPPQRPVEIPNMDEVRIAIDNANHVGYNFINTNYNGIL